MLVSFPSFSKNELIKSRAKIVFSESLDGEINKASSYLGCNTLIFDCKIKNNGKIKFSNLSNTKKPCENIKLETKFITLIKSMNKYKLEGHFLTLSDSKGNEIKCVAADWD